MVKMVYFRHFLRTIDGVLGIGMDRKALEIYEESIISEIKAKRNIKIDHETTIIALTFKFSLAASVQATKTRLEITFVARNNRTSSLLGFALISY